MAGGESLGGGPAPLCSSGTARKFRSALVPSGADLKQGFPLRPLGHVSGSRSTPSTVVLCFPWWMGPTHILKVLVDFLTPLTLSGHRVVSPSASHQGPWSTLENCSCSLAKSHLTLWNPKDCSTPGLPVLQHLPELSQTHVRRVDDAIQPPHPLSSPYFPAFNLFQHQGLFQ